MLFKETLNVMDRYILVNTPFGKQRVKYIHKTPPLECIYIETTNHAIEVSLNHAFVVLGREYIAKDLIIGDLLETDQGLEEITKITPSGVKELYDLTLDISGEIVGHFYDNHTYYSNGILSHNSGKTISTAIYIAWLVCVSANINIGIMANKLKLSQEFLRNTKKILEQLPFWLQPGFVKWNERFIETEYRLKVLVDAASGDAFRGFTINVLIIDECAFISKKVWNDVEDSVFPSQSSLSNKKNIIISTPNGRNHFYDIVQRARKSGTLVEVNWSEIPRWDGATQITPQEFKDKIIQKYGVVHFEQNYGNSFEQSVENLYEIYHIPTQPIIQKFGSIDLRVYFKTSEKCIMAVDPSKGQGDDLAIQIFLPNDDKFIQVATFNGLVNYIRVADDLISIAKYFNADIYIENNDGAGQSLADYIHQRYNYVKFDKGKEYPGIRTTKSTRDKIIEKARILGETKKLIIYDEQTIKQLRAFVRVNNKFVGQGEHDDLVMAFLLCLTDIDTNQKISSIQSTPKSFVGLLSFIE